MRILHLSLWLCVENEDSFHCNLSLSRVARSPRYLIEVAMLIAFRHLHALQLPVLTPSRTGEMTLQR